MTSTYSKEITDLINEASKLYASKNYDLSSLKYGEACEKYSDENDGEEDIELLFLYGKSLFQSGVSKSEAFGGAGAPSGTNENGDTADKNGADNDDEEVNDSDNFQFNETLAEEEDEEDDGKTLEIQEEEEDEAESAQKLDNDGDDGPEEEEQTDFELLWDILDLTRSLLEDKLSNTKEEDIPKQTPYVKADEDKSVYVKDLEKLSETYDLLGEVSLELENFPQAAIDLEKSLELRTKLYEPLSQSISESHYKLSLALEFCIEQEDSRAKAADHLSKALEIVKLQPEKDDELIQDLLVRLADLQKDPAEELQLEKERIIKGILGEKTGDEPESGLASSSKLPLVNDLTSMVVKKKRKPSNKMTPGGVKKQKQ